MPATAGIEVVGDVVNTGYHTGIGRQTAPSLPNRS
jgi:hypothetical protein